MQWNNSDDFRNDLYISKIVTKFTQKKNVAKV